MHKYLAQLKNPALPSSLGQGSIEQGTTATGNLISSLIGVFLLFSFIMAFIYLMLGSISWITSKGDKGKLEEARNKIIHAIIGLIIVAGAWAAWKFLGTWIGIDIEHIQIPVIGQ